MSHLSFAIKKFSRYFARAKFSVICTDEDTNAHNGFIIPPGTIIYGVRCCKKCSLIRGIWKRKEVGFSVDELLPLNKSGQKLTKQIYKDLINK